MKTQYNKHKRTASGFTLIEVLITLVIIAVGILGLASLQLRAMQFVHDAYIRSQVQVLAYDMVDRLRANNLVAMGTNHYNWQLTAIPSAVATNCATTTCTATQMATFDIIEWRQILDEHLPQGTGGIRWDPSSTTGRIYTIEIRWLNDRSIVVTDATSFNKRYETFTFKAEL